MSYVDAFVLAVPKANEAAYFAQAREAAAIWREHGALSYRECRAEDVQPGVVTSFPQAVKLQSDEFVVVTFIVYESRAHRDAVNAKVMADPRMADMMDPAQAPFDMSRMLYGGFEGVVEG